MAQHIEVLLGDREAQDEPLVHGDRIDGERPAPPGMLEAELLEAGLGVDVAAHVGVLIDRAGDDQ